MDVILGTYDEVILGFRVMEIGEDLQIEASFTDNSHAGSVRCVAISKNGLLASGSADETIRLFNLKKQKELGSLMHHDGSITSLDFHKNIMFSTSEDGKLCVWKTSTWECLRTLKGHKTAVNDVSVHPTGKLALTVGKDRSLRTWNLITGRSAFITNLHQVADIVKWSPEGDKYVIIVQNKIDVYSVETAEVIQTIHSEGRINCVEFLNNDVCCFGGEGGSVVFIDITANKQVHVCETGTTRIKGLCISCCQLRKNHDKQRILTIASSEGMVKLYTLKEDKEDISTELLIEHNSGFRVTCLAVYSSKEGKHNETTSVEESVTHNVDSCVDKSDTVDSDDVSDESEKVSNTTQTVKSNATETKTKQNGNKNRKRHLAADTPQDESKKMKTRNNVTEGHKKLDSINKKQKQSTNTENVSKSPISTSNRKKNKRKSGKKE